jgi:hypothetical protein
MGPCVGELSSRYDKTLSLWVATYNCGAQIELRVARQPWGPWSAAQVPFRASDGNCQFIYQSDCPALSDPNRTDKSGGPYGPYLLSSHSTGDATSATLYFVMSTWNPYNTMLMRTTVTPN